ncbi:ribonuclease HII [Calditrichota bacterium]
MNNYLLHEDRLWQRGYEHIAGIDEVGRGPLAGPVVAAAVILKHNNGLEEVIDSKQLSARRREQLFTLIVKNAQAVGISASSARYIDRQGILPATFKAMMSAIRRLSIKPDYLLVDGNIFPPQFQIPGEAIVKGDGQSRSIAAASIVAKVVRDRLMVNLSRFHPHYVFESNKGYGSAAHIRAIHKYGPCCHHRRSFAPVRQMRLTFESVKDHG